jgi:hypothetical protein
MAGLDSIKHFDEGGEVAAESVKEPAAPLSAQSVASKSPYALPTVKGVGGVDPKLLENMQKLIDEREAKKNGFMESMRDATAWWSGGVAGPGEALARRAAEREGHEATTFGMKRDLAQYKIAQQQAENQQHRILGAPAAAPSAATAQGQATQPGSQAQTAPGALIDLIKEPGLKQSIMSQAAKDLNGAEKSIRDYLAANAKDPDIVKKVKEHVFV